MKTEEIFVISKSDLCPNYGGSNPRWDNLLYFVRQTLQSHALVLSSVSSFETEAKDGYCWNVDMLLGRKKDVYRNRKGWTVTMFRDRIRIDFEGESNDLIANESMVRLSSIIDDEHVRIMFYNDFSHMLIKASTIKHTGPELGEMLFGALSD